MGCFEDRIYRTCSWWEKGGAVNILFGVWLGWLGKGMLSTEVGTGGLGWGHALSVRCLGHMGHGWWLGHPCM